MKQRQSLPANLPELGTTNKLREVGLELLPLWGALTLHGFLKQIPASNTAPVPSQTPIVTTAARGPLSRYKQLKNGGGNVSNSNAIQSPSRSSSIMETKIVSQDSGFTGNDDIENGLRSKFQEAHAVEILKEILESGFIKEQVSYY
jgi:hypothetical protein